MFMTQLVHLGEHLMNRSATIEMCEGSSEGPISLLLVELFNCDSEIGKLDVEKIVPALLKFR